MFEDAEVIYSYTREQASEAYDAAVKPATHKVRFAIAEALKPAAWHE